MTAAPYTPDELPGVIEELRRLMERAFLSGGAPETGWYVLPTGRGECGALRDGRHHCVCSFKQWEGNEGNARLIPEAINALPRLLATVEALAGDARGAADAIDAVLQFLNRCDDPECPHEKCVAGDKARKAMLKIDSLIGDE